MKESLSTVTIPRIESPLSTLCALFIETCWLAALVVVPLAYDPHATNSFDPFKFAILRTLGSLTAACLVIRAVSNPGSLGNLFRTQFAWFSAAILVLLTAAISTAISVDPSRSFWGSRQFMQGTLTLFCELALFVGVATHLRSKKQIERLVTVALAASIPVAIYALLQHARLDPLSWALDARPVISFAGQPIYLAGYLLMLLPLCVWRLWQSLTPPTPRWQTLAYMLTLGLQITSFLAANKRGPVVALALAGICGLLLIAAYRRRFDLIKWGLGIAAAGAIFLTALAGMEKAGVPIHSLPLVGRLSMVVPLGAETGDVFRASLWAKAPPLVIGSKSFIFPDGKQDQWHPLRSLIGYGPETLAEVLPRYWLWVPGGPGLITEGRFHNTFWETWQSVGWIGLAAFLCFYLSVFSTGSRSLGFSQKNGGLRLGVVSLITGMGCGALLSAIYGAGYFGLGFQVGFVAGLVLSTLWAAFRSRPTEEPPDSESYRMLTIALLVAFLGHEMDMAFAFPTGNTAVLFWIFAGAIVGLGARGEEEKEPDTEDVPIPASNWAQSGLLAGILGATMLVVILNGFIDFRSGQPMTVGQVLKGTLTQIRFDQGSSHLIPLLLLPTWAIGIACVCGAIPLGQRNRGRIIALVALLSLGSALAFALLKALWIVHIGPIPTISAEASTAIEQAVGFGAVSITMLILLVAAITSVAAILFLQKRSHSRGPVGFAAWAVSAGAAFLVLLTVWYGAVNPLRSEAFSGWADILDVYSGKSLAAALYQEALRVDPNNISDRILCSKEWMEFAEQSKTPEGFAERITKAEAVLLPFRKISELNFANYYLGRLYLRWALREADSGLKASIALRAKDALQRSTNFAPEAETAWFELSAVDRLLLGDARAADKESSHANQITEKIEATPWGDFYAQLSLNTTNSQLKNLYARHAIDYFERALIEGRKLATIKKLSPSDRQDFEVNSYRTLLTKGVLQRSLGAHQAALSTFLEANQSAADVEKWEAQALAAQSYADLGTYPIAINYISKALTTAPASAADDLEKLKLQIAQKAIPQ